jgi:hypothetical protein
MDGIRETVENVISIAGASSSVSVAAAAAVAAAVPRESNKA